MLAAARLKRIRDAIVGVSPEMEDAHYRAVVETLERTSGASGKMPSPDDQEEQDE